jgi:hypothetical protein
MQIREHDSITGSICASHFISQYSRACARVMGIYGPATDDIGPASQCYGGRAHMADWVSAGDH